MKIAEKFKELGIDDVSVVQTSEIPFCESLRELCAGNACGNYGKSWQCPPLIGSFEDTSRRVLQYSFAVLCKNTYKIEDSFDWEGMNCALSLHRKKCKALECVLDGDFLHLSAGGCTICGVCAAKSGENCRFPERASGAPEAYAIDITKLSECAGIEYRSNENEVSYFDIFLIRKKDEKKT